MAHHPNKALLERFYAAFAERDAKTMGACYAPDATFGDPVFPHLDAEEARAMWQMFCERGDDLDIEAAGIEADDTSGRAQWDARYTFGPSKRPVHNRITARFEFEDGFIVKHRDTFNLYRWTRMALGPLGTALGWTPLVQKRVRRQARSQLDRFMARSEPE